MRDGSGGKVVSFAIGQILSEFHPCHVKTFKKYRATSYNCWQLGTKLPIAHKIQSTFEMGKHGVLLLVPTAQQTPLRRFQQRRVLIAPFPTHI